MTNCCMNCDYCDKRRKNAIGMPRCKQHNMFVAHDDCCDFHCNKGVIEKELWTKRKEVVDGDNPTQNQHGNSELNSELKPCPFCGGKARLNFRQAKYYGQTYDGVKKIKFTGYIVCNKCRSRGKPVSVISDRVGCHGCLHELKETMFPLAAEAWNRRATDERAE